MKAYKVFNSDWTCRGFQYEVGKTYKIDVEPILCEKGFHACKKVSDCFSYYDFNPTNKVAEVELSGTVVGEDQDKQAASIITIVKEITWEEMLTLANTGSGNSGDGNSGDGNSGNWNSGNWNSGNRNSGNWNSGNWNSGNWNSGNRNSGMFNTTEPFIRLFNKDTSLTRDDIDIPSFLYFDLTVFVSYDTATPAEREEHKTDIETCGGFLKTLEYKKAFQLAWSNASEGDKERVKALPNFDADIFYEISGIRV